MTTAAKISIACGMALATSIACDRAIGALGYPADWSPPVAYGPNHDEIRRNVEFTYRFRTNSLGIRYGELPLERASTAEYRMLVLGDSYAEGFGVEEPSTFAARLERAFSTPSRQVDFINCGLTGTGPLQYGRVFLDVGLRYHPDGVLIVLHANDVSDTDPRAYDMVRRGLWYIPPDAERSTLRRVAHTIWPHAYLIGRGLLEQYHSRHPENTVDALKDLARSKGISSERIASWEASLPPDLVPLIGTDQFSWWMLGTGLVNPASWTDSLDIDTPVARQRWNAMAGVLTELVRQARTRHLWVAAVFAPIAFQYDPAYGNVWRAAGVHIRPEWLTENTEFQRRLSRWAVDDHVPLLDLTATFREAVMAGQHALSFRMDPHWTAAGHALAAETIRPWLESANQALR